MTLVLLLLSNVKLHYSDFENVSFLKCKDLPIHWYVRTPTQSHRSLSLYCIFANSGFWDFGDAGYPVTWLSALTVFCPGPGSHTHTHTRAHTHTSALKEAGELPCPGLGLDPPSSFLLAFSPPYKLCHSFLPLFLSAHIRFILVLKFNI